MKKTILTFVIVFMALTVAKAQQNETTALASQNLKRSVELMDNTLKKYYFSRDRQIAFEYDVNRHATNRKVSVWEYTCVIEALNSVMEALQAMKGLEPELYAQKYDAYNTQLTEFYRGMLAYRGSYTLASYATHKRWSVYSVDRGANPSEKNNQMNVYDDQMWIIREMLRSYKITGKKSYLDDARYLADYVLDGWDCTLDENGNEYGGITWGPGYTSKHSCSNGPMVSPLVWLAEIDKDKTEKVSYYVLNQDREPVLKTDQTASERYLEAAKKIYAYQQKTLKDGTGLFWDAIWAVTGDITTHTVNGVAYRNHVDSKGNPGGAFFTYNTGAMISGAADLYRVTKDESYLDDINKMVRASYYAFTYNKTIDGKALRLYKADKAKGEIGNPWFNDVLIRSYMEAGSMPGVKLRYTQWKSGIEAAQANLDFGYENKLADGLLPHNLTSADANGLIPVQSEASFISVYAMLATYYYNNVQTLGISSTAETAPVADLVNVYDLGGNLMKSNVKRDTSLTGLQRGVYIVDGVKYAVR